MKLGLYSYWRSSCSYRVRIVLQLKKIEYDYKTIDLLAKVKNPDAKILDHDKNPMGQIPILEVDDGKKKEYLVQSLPIIEYLEEVYPGTQSVFPHDPLLRQKVRAMAEVINSGIQPLQNLSILEEIGRHGGDKTEWARKVIDKGLDALEQMVKEVGGRFCVGDDITLVDCCLIPQFYNAKRYGVNIEKFQNLHKIYERCLEIDAFDKASPEKQPDAPRE